MHFVHFCVYACLHVLDFIKEKEGRNEVNRVPEFKFFSFWESVACGHQYFLIAPEAQCPTLVQKSRAFLDLSQGKVRDSLGKIFKYRDKMQGEAEPW